MATLWHDISCEMYTSTVVQVWDINEPRQPRWGTRSASSPPPTLCTPASTSPVRRPLRDQQHVPNFFVEQRYVHVLILYDKNAT